MPRNASLTSARKKQNDEFYTQYADIEREINAYLEYDKDTFKDKIVLLPCDDPDWSNFTKYFAQNFEKLGIKKLISTSYSAENKEKKYGSNYQYTIFDYDEKYDEKIDKVRGKIFTLEKDINNSGSIDIEDLEWNYLEGDGDFNSDEIKTLRNEADIIVTNPPFSIFRDFLKWIYEGNVHFIIIAPMGSVTYKDVFPYVFEGKMWLGNGFNGGNAYFRLPNDTNTDYANGVFDASTGLVKFRNCCWLTNIEHGKRHQPLDLMTYDDNIKFSKHKEIKGLGYSKYVNADCLECKYVDSIPRDYKGLIGTTPGFLASFCPEQFEIVGCPDADILPDGWNGATQEFVDLYYEQGNTGAYSEGNRLACYIDKNGNAIIPYKRIIIKYTDTWINSHPADFREG